MLAFERTCHTDEGLNDAVENIIRSQKTCPKPCDVYDSARPRQPGGGMDGCQMCDGTGFIMVSRNVQTIDGWRDVEFAQPCTCRPPLPRDVPV